VARVRCRQVRQGRRTPRAWLRSAPLFPAPSRGPGGPESEPLTSTAWAQAPRAARLSNNILKYFITQFL
jgi:hypothetical protein